MKPDLKIFSLLLLLNFFAPFSHAAELKICEAGINKCEPLIDDAAKYSKCMHLMCYEFYSKKDQEEKDESKFYFKFVQMQDENTAPKKNLEEQAKTCEYGLRKCDVLYETPQYYWECMADSCRNPDNKAKPDCPLGQNICVDRQRTYNDCMQLTCGKPDMDFISCPKAREACSMSLRQYWQCVYGVCLGSVEQYKTVPTVKRYMVVQDSNGIKKRVIVNKTDPVMVGGPKWAAKPPAGVDPREWVSETPQKFRLMGNPGEYMQCLLPTAVMDCKFDDIRSCICSDGTAPIMLNGIQSPEPFSDE